MRQKFMMLISAGCACGFMAFAQSNSLSATDRMFMQKAGEGGMAEVQLGQLAGQKGSSQAVKDFGQRMVSDHTQAADKLKGVATNKGVALPMALNAKDKALYDRLSGLSGGAFDREYMHAMVGDHKADAAEFQKESNTGRDSDVTVVRVLHAADTAGSSQPGGASGIQGECQRSGEVGLAAASARFR
jgi:predicted outer membrane protein